MLLLVFFKSLPKTIYDFSTLPENINNYKQKQSEEHYTKSEEVKAPWIIFGQTFSLNHILVLKRLTINLQNTVVEKHTLEL